MVGKVFLFNIVLEYNKIGKGYKTPSFVVNVNRVYMSEMR